MSKATYIEKLVTPLKTWIIGADQQALKWIKTSDEINDTLLIENPNPITNEVVNQLSAYFEGRRKSFDIQFDIEGYSTFSQKVWNALLTIPFGKTISYKQLAIMLGDVKCIRAAASANGRNPIPIIIPCHRVIGSDGSLTGYSMGLDVKRYLLNIEQPDKYGEKQTELSFI